MDIYERIKELCKNEGISVKAMTEKLGIVYSSYYSSQQSKRFPNLSDLIAIADYFGVSLDYLVRGLEKETESDKPKMAIPKIDNLDDEQRAFLIRLFESQIELLKK